MDADKTRSETFPVSTPADIVLVRQAVRKWATELGFSIVDQTKVVTAASELARNTVDYGGGGKLELSALQREDGRTGLQMLFEDEGPGIEDVNTALRDGYTSGTGLGMGLGGSKRLVSEFSIESTVGKGTSVTAIKWR